MQWSVSGCSESKGPHHKYCAWHQRQCPSTCGYRMQNTQWVTHCKTYRALGTAWDCGCVSVYVHVWVWVRVRMRVMPKTSQIQLPGSTTHAPPHQLNHEFGAPRPMCTRACVCVCQLPMIECALSACHWQSLEVLVRHSFDLGFQCVFVHVCTPPNSFKSCSNCKVQLA